MENCLNFFLRFLKCIWNCALELSSWIKIKNQIAAETESAEIDRVQHACSTSTTLEHIEEVHSWLTNDESAQNIAPKKKNGNSKHTCILFVL
jgi:hypothetical protein